jgi:predicted nucleic acid-binding Zn ribbon protein
MTEMELICPKCGSEYSSTEATCYACSELMEAPRGRRERLGRLRMLMLTVGVVILWIGVLLIFFHTHIVHDYAYAD